MNDAENLSKLLGHLPPAVFSEFMADEFDLAMPELHGKQAKREQRAGMNEALSALAVSERQPIEEVAERIVLMSDGAGQDVIEGFRDDIFDNAGRETFAAIRNQYERALWLYLHEPAVFKEALDARQADVFRQSPSCYSGFMAPKSLSIKDDEASRVAFHQTVAEHLGCAVDAVAVQIFKRLRPDTQTGEDVALYQVSIHHNRPPEIIDCVHDSELVAQEVIRAVSSHITYEPAQGHLEVLSKDNDGRETLARIVADALLQSPISGEKIPLKQYDYQSLAAPRNFDLAGENVAFVKVVELGYAALNHRSLLVKIWSTDADDIHAAARELISPTFDFRHHHLHYAKLSIRLKKVGNERARTITIILREDNKCSIKTKREKDRALCDRLLAKWHLVKEIGDVTNAPVDAVAA
ncbi:hypothetical protein E4Q23_16085 [Candidatus Accumulibacter phosphatis]|uniref:Uncharacterized protein n=1 Tax=Candidatus Accumulibacter phosphatis TaxID=327160 RepID=A0ABX1TY65_9PROT|nr:hypothetical protein [Candidatus Accumulibacter phosphatis]NMQ29145.1 hypothetical protein [Candidatus Accumulibacter phosphatis]